MTREVVSASGIGLMLAVALGIGFGLTPVVFVAVGGIAVLLIVLFAVLASGSW